MRSQEVWFICGVVVAALPQPLRGLCRHLSHWLPSDRGRQLPGTLFLGDGELVGVGRSRSKGRAAEGALCSEVPPLHPPLGLKNRTGEPCFQPSVSCLLAWLPWLWTRTNSCRAGAGVHVVPRQGRPVKYALCLSNQTFNRRTSVSRFFRNTHLCLKIKVQTYFIFFFF